MPASKAHDGGFASGPQTEGFATALYTIFFGGGAELKDRQRSLPLASPPRAPLGEYVGSDCGLIADVHRDLTSQGKYHGVIGVDTPRLQSPVLVAYYNRYLSNNDCGLFVKRVGRRYSGATLERLVAMGDRTTRRAAVFALSLVGDYSSNAVLGRALVDRDRGVRTISENGIRELWCRVGSHEQRHALRVVLALNDERRYAEAARLATQLIHESPWIAEAWCQRGTAHYHLGQYEAAIRDCHQALEINPYHFTAAAGMGQCYLLQDNPVAALEAFRRALRLNPGLEEVRSRVVQLQRSLNQD